MLEVFPTLMKLGFFSFFSLTALSAWWNFAGTGVEPDTLPIDRIGGNK
jgi:hypothetical protein